MQIWVTLIIFIPTPQNVQRKDIHVPNSYTNLNKNGANKLLYELQNQPTLSHFSLLVGTWEGIQTLVEKREGRDQWEDLNVDDRTQTVIRER
jgi:hypothetical protein